MKRTKSFGDLVELVEIKYAQNNVYTICFIGVC